jgi:hypothetical protein
VLYQWAALAPTFGDSVVTGDLVSRRNATLYALSPMRFTARFTKTRMFSTCFTAIAMRGSRLSKLVASWYGARNFSLAIDATTDSGKSIRSISLGLIGARLPALGAMVVFSFEVRSWEEVPL